MGTDSARNRTTAARLRTLQFILLVLVSIISYVALIVPLVNIPAASPLQVGEVSPNDYQAPRTHSYISEVLTEQARKDAVSQEPFVRAVLDTFPGAEIVAVREREIDTPPPMSDEEST